MLPSRTIAAMLFALASSLASGAWADCLFLKSGGKLEGQWANREAHPRQYEMVTALGRVIIPATEVERIEVQRPGLEEYRQRAPSTADTVAAQWELANWCRDQKLNNERMAHLRRVVALDPDHYEARQLLGFTLQGGKWISREDLMENKGYVHSRGRWRVGQEVELNTARREREIAEKDWLLRLRRMREGLTGDRAREIVGEFAEIRDPHAVAGLRQLMHEDRWQPAKLMYLKTLREIGTAEAVALMFDVSIRDLDREVRLTSLEQLTAMDPPALVHEYLKVLKSENNVEVNRAAIALEYLHDQSTVVPLIDALVTTHTLVLPGRDSPDTMTTTFSPDGGSGFSTGGGNKSITGQARNADVLAALEQITGRSFGFDQEAWRAWIAAEAQAELQQAN